MLMIKDLVGTMKATLCTMSECIVYLGRFKETPNLARNLAFNPVLLTILIFLYRVKAPGSVLS